MAGEFGNGQGAEWVCGLDIEQEMEKYYHRAAYAVGCSLAKIRTWEAMLCRDGPVGVLAKVASGTDDGELIWLTYLIGAVYHAANGADTPEEYRLLAEELGIPRDRQLEIEDKALDRYCDAIGSECEWERWTPQVTELQ